MNYKTQFSLADRELQDRYETPAHMTLIAWQLLLTKLRHDGYIPHAITIMSFADVSTPMDRFDHMHRYEATFIVE